MDRFYDCCGVVRTQKQTSGGKFPQIYIFLFTVVVCKVGEQMSVPENNTFQFIANTEIRCNTVSPSFKRPFVLDKWQGQDMRINFALYSLDSSQLSSIVEDANEINMSDSNVLSAATLLGASTLSLREAVQTPCVDFGHFISASLSLQTS
jgi:hypothetical protein